jgi:hypothetical protein
LAIGSDRGGSDLERKGSPEDRPRRPNKFEAVEKKPIEDQRF